MNILILSCNTGEGHNSCAKALQKAMLRHDINCEVVDTLSLVSETLSNRVSDAYVFSTKGPFFEIAYKMGELVSDNFTLTKSPIYQSNKLYAKRLYDYIVEYRWALVSDYVRQQGFGNLGDLVSELIQRIRPKDRIICVCGHNKKVYQSLQNEFQDQPQLWVIEFTDQVSVLMDASDVIFTKPEGITSTETIVKGLPLIHTAPIPGLEKHNARFFHYHNLSYHTNDVQQQVTIAMRLAEDETYRHQMLTAQHLHANAHASDDVVRLIADNTAKIYSQ